MISSSLYIPSTAKIIDFSCEILKDSGDVVKGVQYQNLSGVESIVDSITRKSIFVLTDNPNVTKLEQQDLGLCFRVRYNNPGEEMSTVYKIDPTTNYVHKVSHLFFTYAVDAFPETKSKFILNASPESYLNILNYLIKDRESVIRELIIKCGNDWIPFISLDPEKLLPS